jgi:hypothetical protein
LGFNGSSEKAIPRRLRRITEEQEKKVERLVDSFSYSEAMDFMDDETLERYRELVRRRILKSFQDKGDRSIFQLEEEKIEARTKGDRDERRKRARE